MNLPNFWYGSCSYGPLWENHTLYAGKILIWGIKFCPLRPILEFWAYKFQTPLWIFLIFGMEAVLMVLFQKIILYMPGKFWLVKFGPFKAIFGLNWLFWEFLTYNFQTPLWIFLIFGSPDVFRLRKEPINSLSYVRASVHPFRSYSLDRSIFLSIFCMKLYLHIT